MSELKSLVKEGIVEVNSDLHKMIVQLIYFKGFGVNYSRVLIDPEISPTRGRLFGDRHIQTIDAVRY